MYKNDHWKGKEYAFYSHKDCELFPCHKTDDTNNFNCLFCYCPLYVLGRNCGGNYEYTKDGIKDCSNCLLPHQRNSYGYIMARFQEIAGVMRHIEEEA